MPYNKYLRVYLSHNIQITFPPTLCTVEHDEKSHQLPQSFQNGRAQTILFYRLSHVLVIVLYSTFFRLVSVLKTFYTDLLINDIYLRKYNINTCRGK